MKKSKWIKPLCGILCVLVLGGVVMAALHIDSLPIDPILGILRPHPTPDEGDTGTTLPFPSGSDEDPVPPPEDLPPTVDLPTADDGGLSFPCQVPGYNLVIQRLAPYSGMYVEDGTNATVENVAMLMVTNNGDYPVEYAHITVQYGDATLEFNISALPAGENLVVQEKNGQTIPDGKAVKASATIVRRASLDMSYDQVQVTDNGDNTLTITNVTDTMIPTVRVFYKYYMENEDVYVGGIAFTVRVTRLDAHASVTVHPSHYASKTGRVVMVLTYDSEV